MNNCIQSRRDENHIPLPNRYQIERASPNGFSWLLFLTIFHIQDPSLCFPFHPFSSPHSNLLFRPVGVTETHEDRLKLFCRLIAPAVGYWERSLRLGL